MTKHRPWQLVGRPMTKIKLPHMCTNIVTVMASFADTCAASGRACRPPRSPRLARIHAGISGRHKRARSAPAPQRPVRGIARGGIFRFGGIRQPRAVVSGNVSSDARSHPCKRRPSAVRDLPTDKARKIIQEIGANRPAMANLTRAIMRRMFSFAVAIGHRRENPVRPHSEIQDRNAPHLDRHRTGRL